MKFYSIVVITIFGLFGLGCSHYVGGECTYIKTIGTATLVTQEKGICKANFEPLQESWREWNIKPVIKDIEIECQNLTLHQTYPAIYTTLSKGVCTPAYLTIYRVEMLQDFINGSSICMDENNLQTDAATSKYFEDIIEKYTLLRQVDHNLKLSYSITMPPKYSSDYAFSLSLLKAKEFQKKVDEKYHFLDLWHNQEERKTFECKENELEVKFRVL